MTVSPMTFAECFKKALAINGVPWHRPEIIKFLHRKSREMGLKDPTDSRMNVYNWTSGKLPSPEMYAVLAKILGVNVRWLIEGTGDMRPGVKLTPEEQELLLIYRELSQLSCQARDNWVSQGRTMLSLVSPKNSNNPFKR